MSKRKEAVAGMFYPSNKIELENMIKSYLDKVELKEKLDSIKAVVCPHAWYIYSWEIAAYSYKAIEKNWDNIPKTFVILWPSHYSYFSWVSVWMYDYFSTPLWDIEVDKSLWEDLMNKYPDIFNNFEEAHIKEHSLEVQLPFLKYISAWRDFKILPMIFWEVDPIIVWEILNELKKENDFFIIVSSDLSHYKSYDEAIELDDRTLKSFMWEKLEDIKNDAEACWVAPWICLNQIAKLNNWKVELLDYRNSWDTSWTKEQVVGYASLIYKK